MVAESLRNANLSLLLLAIAAIYVCYAIRALRWMQFSRIAGHNAFLERVYSATLMGFTCTFLLGRAGEPIRPVLIAKKDSLSVAGMFGVYLSGADFGHGCDGGAGRLLRWLFSNRADW